MSLRDRESPANRLPLGKRTSFFPQFSQNHDSTAVSLSRQGAVSSAETRTRHRRRSCWFTPTGNNATNQTLGYSFETQDLCTLRFATNRGVSDFLPPDGVLSKYPSQTESCPSRIEAHQLQDRT
ncbi:uncharacterized protein LOC113565652 [Drosophila persimilis]|uniref:uncharacterized protein LOC113565652 n=1 Tax=Drosophila persimilis TaxID=7234 RepID=UPI000F098B85|nr:uncharacterized protein LOC113565652 [Drosophila persimilis]